MALIERDGLPINSMVIFHGYVSQNQMVDKGCVMLFGLNIYLVYLSSGLVNPVLGYLPVMRWHQFKLGHVSI